MRCAAAGGTALAILVAGVLVGAPAHADTTRDAQWHLGFLKIAEAHRQSQGEDVIVAVIDTGVQANHPDLTGNVLPGATTTVGASGDGRTDPVGHGTGMAGIIAGHGHGSGDGVLGIAPRARLLPVTGLLRLTEIDSDPAAIPKAIDYAVQNGAEVINMSVGGGGSPEEQAAVNRALAADVVVVAATGNKPLVGLQIDAPARYPGVLAVAAVDRNANHAQFSMTGPEVVLAAPGVEIVSTRNDGTYRRGTGTSDATAIISGAAALIRAKYPQLSAKDVIHRLTATATDKGPPGRDEQYGYGVINLVDALTRNVPPLANGTTTASPSVTAGATASPPSGAGGRRGVLLLGGFVLVLLALLGGWIVLRRGSANG